MVLNPGIAKVAVERGRKDRKDESALKKTMKTKITMKMMTITKKTESPSQESPNPGAKEGIRKCSLFPGVAGAEARAPTRRRDSLTSKIS